MEKAPSFELEERKDQGDKLQLISGSTASTLPRDHSGFGQFEPSSLGSKEEDGERSCCSLQTCCLSIVALIAILALGVSVAAIIIIIGFPNINNGEVLAVRAELMAQMASTGTPAPDTITEELTMIRDTLQNSVSALQSSLQTTINTVRNSIQANSMNMQRIRDTVESSVSSLDNSLGNTINTVSDSVDGSFGPVSNLLQRMVTVQEDGVCLNPPELFIGTAANPATSCRDIPADRPSGNYWIQTNDTCPIQVYCDLDGSACSCRCETQQGGWMRVANLDMTDPNQNCPDSLVEMTDGTPQKRVCARPGPLGCSSIIYPVNGVEYSRVCGKVIGYRKDTPDGINTLAIDNHYVDGVSITHGSSPRNHIWTFIAAWGSHNRDIGCPCETNDWQGTLPSYVGSDYFCEAGHVTNCCEPGLTTNNPVWDGQDCVATSKCCVFNAPPYFCKTLDTPTTNDIEVRVCGNQDTGDEDTPIEVVELYVY